MMKKIAMILLLIILSLGIPRDVWAAPVLTASSTPDPLQESNLNGAVIHLDLTGDVFLQTIGTADIKLNKAPPGTSVSGVNRISDIKADVILAFDGTDFDATITDFVITVLATGVAGGSNINTEKLVIYAIIEDIGVTAASTPATLVEPGLDGALITLTLYGNVDFATVTVDEFILNNAPPGMSLASASKYDPNIAYLTLAFNGADFDSDFPDFNITVKPLGNNKNVYITSNNLLISSQIEVEGMGNYIVTGKSSPTMIQVAGYNSRDQKLYLNFEMGTDRVIGGTETAAFYYYIEVFDNSSNLIGSLGDIDNPQTIAASPGMNTVRADNIEVLLGSPLNAAYRIVITIKEIVITA